MSNDPLPTSLTPAPLILRALRNEVTERPPVWFMRQAGRYLPEYRALRGRSNFLEMCHDADLAAEVTLQPLRRYGFDAGIIFSDILLPLQSMGMELRFEAGEGPRFPKPLVDEADVRGLKDFDPLRDLPAPMQAIRLCRAATDTPILGFAGAPFTLACYATEGGGSDAWVKTKRMMYERPALFQALLDRLADAVGDHLQAQIDAGAVGVQLFDTWAGALCVEDLRRFALPAAARALARVKGAPRIFFTRDAGPFLPYLREVGADAYGLDWRVDMAAARAALGDVPVQGNLDPISLYAPPAEVARRVRSIIAAAGDKGFVFNLGHGIHLETPLEGVGAAVAAVKEWSWT